MSGEAWTVNSENSLTAFIVNAKQLFEEHKYLTWPKPRIGPDRSLDQNALLHVWATEYAAHLLKKDKKQVTKGELEGMKRISKKKFYGETGEAWMVHDVVNPLTGDTKRDFTSSKDWKRGEMFTFLTWLQAMAAGHGLVLESKGEYAKLQRGQNQ